MAVAYLGLGGNLGSPLVNLKSALDDLRAADGVTVTAISKAYVTKPVGGPSGQPDYVNAAVAIQCLLPPRELLNLCLTIERKIGRVRGERWSARTIDIDLLLFAGEVIELPGLAVPHPMLRKRLFVLLPLADVAPHDLELPPDGKRLRDVLRDALADPYFLDQLPLQVLETGIA